tara:strand:+ start:1193 stop:1378 length:186 start_codon:yes stop_codon:yes gene_type:complete
MDKNLRWRHGIDSSAEVVELYTGDTYMRDTEVFFDHEGREYICLDNKIIYLKNLKKWQDSF